LELTTLDILKRRLPDGRIYYMLYVTRDDVLECNYWDQHEGRLNASAPYLLQAARHPRPVATSNIRIRLTRLSSGTATQRADGTRLVLRHYDCRRMFASEHLNSNRPIHVIRGSVEPCHARHGDGLPQALPIEPVEGYRRAPARGRQSFHLCSPAENGQ
jgi:hypothetical protein